MINAFRLILFASLTGVLFSACKPRQVSSDVSGRAHEYKCGPQDWMGLYVETLKGDEAFLVELLKEKSLFSKSMTRASYDKEEAPTESSPLQIKYQDMEFLLERTHHAQIRMKIGGRARFTPLESGSRYSHLHIDDSGNTIALLQKAPYRGFDEIVLFKPLSHGEEYHQVKRIDLGLRKGDRIIDFVFLRSKFLAGEQWKNPAYLNQNQGKLVVKVENASQSSTQPVQYFLLHLDSLTGAVPLQTFVGGSQAAKLKSFVFDDRGRCFALAAFEDGFVRGIDLSNLGSVHKSAKGNFKEKLQTTAIIRQAHLGAPGFKAFEYDSHSGFAMAAFASGIIKIWSLHETTGGLAKIFDRPDKPDKEFKVEGLSSLDHAMFAYGDTSYSDDPREVKGFIVIGTAPDKKKRLLTYELVATRDEALGYVVSEIKPLENIEITEDIAKLNFMQTNLQALDSIRAIGSSFYERLLVKKEGVTLDAPGATDRSKLTAQAPIKYAYFPDKISEGPFVLAGAGSCGVVMRDPFGARRLEADGADPFFASCASDHPKASESCGAEKLPPVSKCVYGNLVGDSAGPVVDSIFYRPFFADDYSVGPEHQIRLVFAHQNGALRAYNVFRGKDAQAPSRELRLGPKFVQQARVDRRIRNIAISRDQAVVLTLSDQNELLLWNIETHVDLNLQDMYGAE